MTHLRPLPLIGMISLATLLASCAVGPNFKRPAAPKDAERLTFRDLEAESL